MRAHSGFGTGTAISLACLEALHLLNDLKPTPAELINASGRGGTSGVGIHSYFSGGFVFDLGRKASNKSHAPSHTIKNSEPPLLLEQRSMPDWEIGICIPSNIPHKSQAEERDFFKRTCPLTAEAVYATTYHAIFGLYAAIREADKAAFCKALREIQACDWKKAERLEYGQALMDIEQALYANSAEAVGMSSLGPSLFFLADNVAEIINLMRIARPDCEWLLTHPVNHGRVLHDV